MFCFVLFCLNQKADFHWHHKGICLHAVTLIETQEICACPCCVSNDPLGETWRDIVGKALKHIVRKNLVQVHSQLWNSLGEFRPDSISQPTYLTGWICRKVGEEWVLCISYRVFETKRALMLTNNKQHGSVSWLGYSCLLNA